MTALRYLVLVLVAIGGIAAAQDDANDAIIDLGPMLDLMPATPGAGSTGGPSTGGPTSGEAPLTAIPPKPAPAPFAQPSPPNPPADAVPPLATGAVDVVAPPSVPAVIDAPLRSTPPKADIVTAAAPVRLPLRAPGGVSPLRLFGEYDSAEFLLDLSTLSGITGLELLMQSSVSILPETSLITITVNGTPAIETRPFAFDGFAPLQVPTGALVVGTNRIGIAVRQSHRIFCGPEATFQIWTEIDAAASGVTLTPGALLSETQDFRAAVAGMAAITVIATEPPDPALMAEIVRRLAASEGRAAPAITVATPWEPDLAGPESARIAIRADAGAPAMIRVAADGVPVLVLAPDAPPAALDAFLPAPVALADNPAMVPGILTSLADLKLPDIVIRRRYGRVDVPFTLPEDWMLRASQSARIDLLYRYAEGLSRNALMLVKVNGVTVRLLPLFGQPDTALPLLPVGFSTRLLQAGTNVVSFETIVPGDPPDLPCSPIDGPLVEIFAESRIDVPPSPRMVFPSATALLRNLAPAGIAAAEGAVPDSLAGTVVRALGAAFVPLDTVPGAMGADPSRLTVAGLAEIDRLPLTALGLTRRSLQDVLAVPLSQPMSAAEPAVSTGPVARITGRVGDLWAEILRLGWPGDPPLGTWLQGRQGVAFLLLPDPMERMSGWLVASPGVDPIWLAQRVADARRDPDGPKGEAALLTRDGDWQVWQPAATPPVLLEPVTLANVRTVAGNYAAWSPMLYVALLGSLLILSVITGLIFVVRTRGRRMK